jgi:Outer membrane protein beta-barrel domain
VRSSLRPGRTLTRVFIAGAILSTASTAWAQTQARVIAERATIWYRDPSRVAAIVKQGIVLDVTAQEGQWYEVRVPPSEGGRGEVGIILAAHVELLPGSPPPPTRPPRTTLGSFPQAPARQPPAFRVNGFGQLGLMAFSAQDSFEAVLGRSTGPAYGGGIRLAFGNGIFAEVGATWYKKTGTRVFVFEDEVFDLGIPVTVQIVPVSVTGGYRSPERENVSGYVGGGVGVYFFKEEATFAAAGEDVDERFTSYHVLAGVEYRGTRWLGTAFEVQYTTVPDALGLGGVSAVFDEDNLGGFQVQLKVLVGR